MYILLAIFSGFTILLSILMLGKINQSVGLLQTSFISFSVGSIGALLLMFIMRDFNFIAMKSVPFYLYFGFVVVISITMLNSKIINNIPATFATILVFIGQLATGMVIDYFRFHTFSFGDLLGGLLILGGLYYNNNHTRVLNKQTQNTMDSILES